MNQKLISVIFCCRNEGAYIDRSLTSLIEQKEVPAEFELLVVDGMSDDNTREIITEKMKVSDRVRLFDNETKIKVTGVNIGFKNAEGEYLVICDAHTIYEKTYLATLVKLIREHPEADCVGGPVIHLGENSFAQATAAAMSNPVVVGNPKHRFPDYEGYAEMACWPLFRHQVLDKIGLYDEEFIINHDDEYCYRLRNAGGKIYLSPRAKCFYYVRKDPIKLFYQYWTYGFWQILFLKKHKTLISFRHLIPSLFVLSLIAVSTADIFIEGFPFSLIFPAVYISILIVTGIKVIPKRGFFAGLLFPIAAAIMHVAYGMAFLTGIFYFGFKKTNHPRNSN